MLHMICFSGQREEPGKENRKSVTRGRKKPRKAERLNEIQLWKNDKKFNKQELKKCPLDLTTCQGLF